MKISVQSLFEDYEENTVPLSRDADAERILEKTRAKLPGVKRKRPLGLVLVAAAAGRRRFVRRGGDRTLRDCRGRCGKLHHAGHAPL